MLFAVVKSNVTLFAMQFAMLLEAMSRFLPCFKKLKASCLLRCQKQCHAICYAIFHVVRSYVTLFAMFLKAKSRCLLRC